MIFLNTYNSSKNSINILLNNLTVHIGVPFSRTCENKFK